MNRILKIIDYAPHVDVQRFAFRTRERTLNPGLFCPFWDSFDADEQNAVFHESL
jgi:hypothetical protein